MNDRVRQRLQELKQEHAAGEEKLRQLEARSNELKHTLLRIAGAIQVLEEMLAEGGPG